MPTLEEACQAVLAIKRTSAVAAAELCDYASLRCVRPGGFRAWERPRLRVHTGVRGCSAPRLCVPMAGVRGCSAPHPCVPMARVLLGCQGLGAVLCSRTHGRGEP
jgi:hypothetical protein